MERTKYCFFLLLLFFSAIFVAGCQRTIIMPDDGIYGELFYYDTETNITLISNWSYILLTAFTNEGEYSLTIPNATSDTITIQKSGDYFVMTSFSTRVDKDDVLVDTCVFVNGVEQNHMHIQRTFKINGDVYTGTMGGLLRLRQGDVLDVRVKAVNGVNDNVTLTALYGNFNLHYLGDAFLSEQRPTNLY